MARAAARSRIPLVAGNWKSNRGGPEGAALAKAVVEGLGGRAPEGVEVALLPPFTAIPAVAQALEGTGIATGAQDCGAGGPGAFTGFVDAGALAAWKCVYVLCGHSERRRLAGEDDAAVRAKVGAALAAGLRPVLCVGETLEERDAGRTAEVLERQASAGVAGLSPADARRLEVAYEPVWAIGTGRNATPEQAAEGHRAVRGALARSLGREAADSVRVIYGGSVSAANAAALLSAPGVDGALVGGASLDAAGFAAIVRAAVPETSGAARGGK
jgi:triosephosphate isomerase